jgi:hypothetical protein
MSLSEFLPFSKRSEKTITREAQFKDMFRNSPSFLRRLYWISAFSIDFIGCWAIYLLLSSFYSYIALYSQGFLLRHLSLMLFFTMLGVLGFFFHTQITLRLLSLFYEWWHKRRKGRGE